MDNLAHEKSEWFTLNFIGVCLFWVYSVCFSHVFFIRFSRFQTLSEVNPESLENVPLAKSSQSLEEQIKLALLFYCRWIMSSFVLTQTGVGLTRCSTELKRNTN